MLKKQLKKSLKRKFILLRIIRATNDPGAQENADLLVSMRGAIFFDSRKKGVNQVLISMGIGESSSQPLGLAAGEFAHLAGVECSLAQARLSRLVIVKEKSSLGRKV